MKRTYRFLLLPLLLLGINTYAQQAKTVLLDSYFNDEHKADASGKMISYHYKWEETDNNGFSIFGDAFKRNGAILNTLYEKPSATNLSKADIYIIVDPDTKKESPDPKYIGFQQVMAITNWVRQGGVLLLMANDSANVELKHFNTLSQQFGIHFNDDLRNHVKDDQHFQDGAFTIDRNNEVLKTSNKIFMKDICSLTLSRNAQAVLKDGDATIIAITKFGKGTVIAVGDPWLYNEYTNGRLPADFENDKAANDLAKWLVEQIPQKK